MLAMLDDRDAVFFPKAFYLLESLSSVKSIVIVADLPHADELISNYFEHLYTKSESTQNITSCITDILHQLIEESSHIPSDVISTILLHLSRKSRVWMHTSSIQT